MRLCFRSAVVLSCFGMCHREVTFWWLLDGWRPPVCLISASRIHLDFWVLLAWSVEQQDSWCWRKLNWFWIEKTAILRLPMKQGRLQRFGLTLTLSPRKVCQSSMPPVFCRAHGNTAIENHHSSKPGHSRRSPLKIVQGDCKADTSMLQYQEIAAQEKPWSFLHVYESCKWTESGLDEHLCHEGPRHWRAGPIWDELLQNRIQDQERGCHARHRIIQPHRLLRAYPIQKLYNIAVWGWKIPLGVCFELWKPHCFELNREPTAPNVSANKSNINKYHAELFVQSP